MAAGWLVDVDDCAVDVAGFPPPNSPLGPPLVGAPRPDVAGAELPLPAPANSEGAGAAAVVVPELPAVVVAPLVGVVAPGAEEAGVPMLANILEAGAADDFGASGFPPKLKPPRLGGGCEDAGAAEVVPRLKVGGLLAGVDEVVGGVNSDGLAAPWPCEPADGPPPKRPDGAEDAGVGPLSAPAEVSLFPPNSPEVGVELPKGLPAGAPPNSPGAGEEDVVAGFPPNRDGLGWLEPLA